MFKVTVTPDDGEEYSLALGARDILNWERTVRGATMDKLQSPSMQDVYSLSWAAAVRQGKYVGDLPSFEASNDVAARSADVPDPTRPEA